MNSRVNYKMLAVDDDTDKNRLVVDIYFYVVGVLSVIKAYKHFYRG